MYNNINGLLLVDGQFLVAYAEGSGDNLSEEDLANGMKDYVLVSTYQLNQDGDNLSLAPEDSGDLMLPELVARYEDEDLEARVLDFAGFAEMDYIKLR